MASPLRSALRSASPPTFLSRYQGQPLIRINNATFYREFPVPHQPKRHNPPMYPKLRFELTNPEEGDKSPHLQHWAVIGNSGTEFLDVLRGRYVCDPPTARSYPHLSDQGKLPQSAIQYVGSHGDLLPGGLGGSYISARYESRQEDTDFSVLQYLQGQTSLNPSQEELDASKLGSKRLEQIIQDLRLAQLLDMPVANLSNGQKRRARIAKALHQNPEILLLDQPFLGLDPSHRTKLTKLLHRLAVKGSPRIIYAIQPRDELPHWITHVAILGPNSTIAYMGRKNTIFRGLEISKYVALRIQRSKDPATAKPLLPKLRPRLLKEEEEYNNLSPNDKLYYALMEERCLSDGFGVTLGILHELGWMPTVAQRDYKRPSVYGEPIIQMEGVSVRYGDKIVLGDYNREVIGGAKEDLHWEVRRGQRWGVFGGNGSGKTTLMSLITSDHPQAYAQPVKLFGRSRLPEPGKPGVSIFDLQSRMGQSSPEIHPFFPRHLSIRASIESAWAETFLSKPTLTDDRNLAVNSILRFFEADLNPNFRPREPPQDFSWSTSLTFSSLSFYQQRLVLFMRALVHKPDLIILDEAFSSMPHLLRDKCLHFLESGETYRESTGLRRVIDPSLWNIPSPLDESRAIQHHGLTSEQSLIVIAHVKEDVPDSVGHWLHLPPELHGGSKVLRKGAVGHRHAISVRAWDPIWNPISKVHVGSDKGHGLMGNVLLRYV
ncbi:hypothetical protein AJ80_04791 [Polytolypa hystricis UAMH7299]|uniref:ABC transporter domain-containing protein n=1 Tax=Polytolypa hystricis (strain UAMH7299) TaxID=1447883 RepID=A0A2B7Y8N9_POLH7|nr:hypothetical protein AJ80_04791 [Polytolypa hystricis UAMH7299]